MHYGLDIWEITPFVDALSEGVVGGIVIDLLGQVRRPLSEEELCQFPFISWYF